MALIKQKYRFWVIGIIIAMIFTVISNISKAPEPAERTVITINAPENMQSGFQKTLEKLKVEKQYELQYTDNPNANFTVSEGSNANGELIAYSPFVAVFNSDEKLYDNLVKEEIFVPSKVDSDWDDFDFKKIMDQSLSTDGSSFKIYYPSQDSDYWDEFYNFLLFTANDGYYPKAGTNMEETVKTVEEFLSCKNVEPVSSNSLKRINSIPQNSIYFITYADLAYIYRTSGISGFIVMYPKTVVYHSYYMAYDETGKILYDFLSQSHESFFGGCYDTVGYDMLYYYSYLNTRYTSGTVRFTSTNYNDIKKRDQYNAVEIPEVTINNNITDKKEEQ